MGYQQGQSEAWKVTNMAFPKCVYSILAFGVHLAIVILYWGVLNKIRFSFPGRRTFVNTVSFSFWKINICDTLYTFQTCFSSNRRKYPLLAAGNQCHIFFSTCIIRKCKTWGVYNVKFILQIEQLQIHFIIYQQEMNNTALYLCFETTGMQILCIFACVSG